MTATIEEARAAKTQVKKELSRVPGLVGVGLTRQGDGYAVKVNLQAALSKQFSTEIGGVPLIFEVVGAIKAS
ncbi:MAG TPA: hypothetical protein VMR43_07615 [Variovorax sp.]|nr:hypothetical protein [Variovorax sp.]